MAGNKDAFKSTVDNHTSGGVTGGAPAAGGAAEEVKPVEAPKTEEPDTVFADRHGHVHENEVTAGVANAKKSISDFRATGRRCICHPTINQYGNSDASGEKKTGIYDGRATRVAKEPTPREPTVGQRAIAERNARAPLTRKPWRGSSVDTNDSIHDVAQAHLAHLQHFLDTNKGNIISSGDDEAKDHAAQAMVHIAVAHSALKDALAAKNGDVRHSRDKRTKDYLYSVSGGKSYPVMTKPGVQDVQEANQHLSTVTDAINTAHQHLMEPSVLRAAKDVPSPEGAAPKGISPRDNHAATKGFAVPRSAKASKTDNVAGVRFSTKDPWYQEQLARVAIGIAGGSHGDIKDVYNQTVRGRVTPLGGAAWTKETSPQRRGRTRGADSILAEPNNGKPTSGAVDPTTPKTTEDLERIATEDAVKPMPQANAKKVTRARVITSAQEGARLRKKDADQKAADEARLQADREADPNHPASKDDDYREAVRARVQAAVDKEAQEKKVTDAFTKAERTERNRANAKKRREAKKAAEAGK